MTNIFTQDPIYITVASVRDSTQKPAIISLSDDAIKKLIYQAQLEVDNYIETPKFAQYDEEQDWLFPIFDKDEASIIPNDVKVATLYTIEQIYENGDAISSGSSGEIKKEKTGPHEVEYIVESYSDMIPDQAKTLLDKYKTSYFGNIV